MGRGGKRRIFSHGGQSYACIGCGKCCRLWDVPVTAAEKDRISRLEIAGLDLPSPECFASDKRRRNIFLIRKIAGNCVFLDGNSRCRIHSLHGEKAKPLACRIYPFDVFNWKDGSISASFRFDCPAVIARKGRKIGEYTSQITGFAEELERSGILCDAKYGRGLEPGLDKLREVAEGYKAILLESGFAPATRILAAAKLLEFHSRKEFRSDILDADGSFRSDALGLARRSLGELEEAISEAPPLDVRRRILFRYLLSGFIRTDEKARYGGLISGRVRRMREILSFSLGRGNVSDFLPDCDGAISDPLAALEKTVFTPDAWETYWTYLGSKLGSMHFCGYPAFSYSFEEGVRHMLVTFPAVAAVASLYGKSSGDRIQADADSIGKAIMAIDHTFSRSPFFRLSRTRKIAEEFCRGDVLPSLLAKVNTH